MRPPITITITITGSIWPDYYYYCYSGILRSLLLLLSRHKHFITITITISNSLTTLRSCMVIGFQMLHILLYFPVYFTFRDFRRFADGFADEFADVGVK